MFNLGTIFLFILGFTYFFIRKKQTKKNIALTIYIISFISIYILSSIILNNILIKNYLDNIDNGIFEYVEIKKDLLDEFEYKDFPDEKEYGLIVDYLEGRYRAYYYVINGEEIYQQIGYGLLYYENEDAPARKQVKLIYNKYLKLFFFQYKTKTYNIITGPKEDFKFIE